MINDNNIELEYTYNEELLNSILEEYNVKLPNKMINNAFCVEEDVLTIADRTKFSVSRSEESTVENIKYNI